MKAGTTWLYDVMSRNDAVAFSHEKEVHYFYAAALRPGLLSDRARIRRAKAYLSFDPEKSALAPLRKRVSWTAQWLDEPVDDAWFKRLFPQDGVARWIADFSNLNALLPADDWRALHGRTRKLRVLYTLREPMDRLWSHVRFHLKLQGRSHLLDDWTIDELATHILEGDYLEHSDYVSAIRRMRQGLPAECVHIDFFDRIGTDPRGFISEIEAFLEVPPTKVPDDIIARVINPSPPKALSDDLKERFAPFVENQYHGLRDLGLTLPASWG